MFEEETDQIEKILIEMKEYGLRHYRQRKVLKARNSYERCKEQLHYNWWVIVDRWNVVIKFEENS